jgi:hypothetical protein
MVEKSQHQMALLDFQLFLKLKKTEKLQSLRVKEQPKI